jgi:hypothetical protein
MLVWYKLNDLVTSKHYGGYMGYIFSVCLNGVSNIDKTLDALPEGNDVNVLKPIHDRISA